MPRVESPDGALAAEVDLDGRLAVERDGRTLLEPSGFELSTPDGPFPDAFAYEDREDRTVEETYDLAHGKRATATHRAAEATFRYAAGGDRRVDLVVRAAPDGIAYRYRLGGDGRARLDCDRAAFRLPQSAVGWLTPYAANHESSARQVPVSRAEGEFNVPGLFDTDAGWVLLCEAGVDGRWAASRLVAGDGRTVHLRPAGSAFVRFPLETPWRVAVAGDLGTVVESTLVTDLVDPDDYPEGAEPEADVAPDADWIEPGRVAWSWWSDSESPTDPDRQREYVDYAAERGWEYVLIDAGWDPSWVPHVVSYAADRGVGALVWTHYTELNTPEKREARLPRWADWGVDGIKVDFMDADDQGRLQFYDDLAAAAAGHDLLVNFHGSVVPTGLSRRWPHVMTYEGVMGAEHYKWETLSPEHNATLPFTRNVVGPMDYTPVTFSADSRSTSAGHELAQSVVFESGLQHLADSTEAYANRPLAESFLEAVPAAWEETRFLRGRPGVEATLARRAGDEWFVGSLTAGPARTVALDPAFGGDEATVIRDDGDDGGLVRERLPADDLSVPVAENGGFVARL